MKNPTYPKIMSHENESCEDDMSISNMFANYFNTFYSVTHIINSSTSPVTKNANNSQLNISNIFILLKYVYEALSTIGNNKKAGPDLPAILFQN